MTANRSWRAEGRVTAARAGGGGLTASSVLPTHGFMSFSTFKMLQPLPFSNSDRIEGNVDTVSSALRELVRRSQGARGVPVLLSGHRRVGAGGRCL